MSSLKSFLHAFASASLVLPLMWAGMAGVAVPPTFGQLASSSVPPAVAAALDTIGREVDYVSKHVPWQSGMDLRGVREFAVAVSAMNFVQQRVSSLQYGYRLHTAPGDLPNSVESCLVENAGICGNQVAVYIELVRRMGLPVRSVEFYWLTAQGQPVSHVGAEVQLGGRWRYFDVTWGSYFVAGDGADGKVPFYDRGLSFDELQRLPAARRRRVTNESALVYQLQLQQRIDPFEYISADKSVLYGKTGSILLTGERHGATFRYRPTNRPGYFGVVQDYSSPSYGETSLTLKVPNEAATLEVNVGGVVCAEGKVRIQATNKTYELPLPARGEKGLVVPLEGYRGLLSLAMASGRSAEPCYIAFNHIDVQPFPRATAVRPQSKQ